MRIGDKETDPDTSLDTTDIPSGITIQITIDLTKNAQDHINGIETAITEAVPDDPAHHTELTVTGYTVTHHIDHNGDHPHIPALQVINSENAAGHTPSYPTDPQDKNHKDQVHILVDQKKGHTPRKMRR